MALFTKKLGPVFLKENNSTQKYIEKLEELLAKTENGMREKLVSQISMAKRGLAGEKNIAFELKNSGMDMYILHDIYLEHNDLSAQIDYLVITRKHIYVIECKNLIGNIEVDNTGSFIRIYEVAGNKVRKGIYSPITQNSRHLQVLKELRKESKGNFLTKTIFEKYFNDNYKSLVVLANPETVLSAKYAKKEIKEQIVRADQLINKIREMDEMDKDSAMSDKEMLEIANFYLSKDRSERMDYAKKYEEMIIYYEDEHQRESATKEREAIVARLKEFRKEQSKIEQIKPYYIFNDAQLEDLISKAPRTKEELLKISGFGEIKTEKYGDKILEILQEL